MKPTAESTTPAADPTAPRFADARTSAAWLLGAAGLPAHIDPAHVALRWGTEQRTYSELKGRALALAGAFRSRGLVRGDRVVANLLNRGETFELYFACAYAGLTLVPVNWRLAERELSVIIEDCKPKIVITQQDLADCITPLAEARGAEVIVLEDDASGGEYDALASGGPWVGPFETCDPHLILYTSGTTGRPKGVMIGHQTIVWYALQQIAYLHIDKRTEMLLVAPTFNTAGINEQSIPTFLAGGTVTIHPSRGWTPKVTAQLVEQWKVTHTLLYPSMMKAFLEEDPQAGLNLDSLRTVATGGENCPPTTMAAFQARWPKLNLCVAYGSTESGTVTYVDGDDVDRHPGSIGRVAMGMSVRIEKPDGEEAAVGEVGELCAAGGGIVLGYWNAPELTDATIQNGWYRTGDLARVDSDGYVYLQGREKDLIISKAQNIYPAEIENVLAENDDLLESTVVGLADPEWGEIVCAVVVAKSDRAVTEESVIAFVRDRLASYKKPRRVVLLDQLPRNPSGKVLKRDLVERIGGSA